MKFAFRVDASTEMGSGHLARCLSLGQSLIDLGWHVVFVVRPLDTVAEKILADHKAMEVIWLSHPSKQKAAWGDDSPPHAAWAKVDSREDALETIEALREFQPDWVIVDHYSFDRDWHWAIASGLGCRMSAVDDLGDRDLDVNLLIDPNWDLDHESKYCGRLPEGAVTLFGPRFALLSEAYKSAAPYQFSESVNSIGIFLGGTDVENYSLVAARACAEINRFQGEIEILVRRTNPNLHALLSFSAQFSNVTITTDQPNLAGFFARHDLQIGAGGGATWERCCLGVPSLLVAFAENQRRVVRELIDAGVAAGADSLDADGIARAVQRLIADPDRRRQMARKGRSLVDGLGCLRVGLSLSRDGLTLRRAKVQDASTAFVWRNDTNTRRFSRDPRPLNEPSHITWWENTLTRTDQHLLIAEIGRRSIGVLRLDLVSQEEAEISVYLDPVCTGVGIGSCLLRSATSWTLNNLQAVRRISADIDPRNANSQRAFKATGYSNVAGRNWVIEVR